METTALEKEANFQGEDKAEVSGEMKGGVMGKRG